jgi:hypothetical protein
MEAAQDGDLDALQRAFPADCDATSVNRKDEDGRTALVSESFISIFEYVHAFTNDIIALGSSKQIEGWTTTFGVCQLPH